MRNVRHLVPLMACSMLVMAGCAGPSSGTVTMASATDGDTPSLASSSPDEVADSESAAIATAPATQEPQLPDVFHAQRISESSGWVLTDHGLSRTDDAGSTWEDITPAISARDGLGSHHGDIAFIDEARGWVAAPGGADATSRWVDAFVTVDGGRSWQGSRVDVSPNAGSVDVGALGESFAWIVVRDVSSSNFSVGNLHVSVDGGGTWRRYALPAAGAVTFADEMRALLVGGPGSEQVHETVDGGRSWLLQEGLTALNEAGIPRAYGPAVINADGGMIVPFSSAGESEAMAGYYSRDADDARWLEHSVAVAGPVEQGVVLPTSVTSSGAVVILAPLDGRILTFDTQEATVDERLLQGLENPVGADFVDATHGWSVAGVPCIAEDPATCSFQPRLFATDDGGASWTLLSP